MMMKNTHTMGMIPKNKFGILKNFTYLCINKNNKCYGKFKTF